MKSCLKNVTIILIVFLLHLKLDAQEKKDIGTDKTGFLSMGARNCISVFTTNGKRFVGTGMGGQFALQIAKDFNSHWFADWINSNINNLAQRSDFHSGFSMMPTVFSPRIGKSNIAIYPLGGFCIDYTKFVITSGKNISSGPNYAERY